MQLSNAGHPHPILYDSEKNLVTEIKVSDETESFGAIGLTGANVKFQDCNFTMKENDILLIFTDGITEAANKEGEFFGKNRLMNLLNLHHQKSAPEIQDAIMSELNLFTGVQPRNDDITMIVLKKEKPEDFIEQLE